MSLEVNVKCCNSSCNHVEKFPLEEIAELEATVEREMGTESTYDVEFEYDCPMCKTELSVEGQVFEYPVGAINSEEIKVKKV